MEECQDKLEIPGQFCVYLWLRLSDDQTFQEERFCFSIEKFDAGSFLGHHGIMGNVVLILREARTQKC